MSLKAVFIDRDGTINVEKNYVSRIEDFELIPGSLEALRLLTNAGVDIYIITNQSGIARGFYTEEDFKKLTSYILDFFKMNGVLISEVLYCPHHPEGKIPQYAIDCECRKPGTKLLESVFKKKGYLKKNAVLIGDKNTDIISAKKIGITSYLVETGFGSLEKSNTLANYVMIDLMAAVVHLLKNWLEEINTG